VNISAENSPRGWYKKAGLISGYFGWGING
jgi:hypothetical protein